MSRYYSPIHHYSPIHLFTIIHHPLFTSPSPRAPPGALQGAKTMKKFAMHTEQRRSNACSNVE